MGILFDHLCMFFIKAQKTTWRWTIGQKYGVSTNWFFLPTKVATRTKLMKENQRLEDLGSLDLLGVHHDGFAWEPKGQR